MGTPAQTTDQHYNCSLPWAPDSNELSAQELTSGMLSSPGASNVPLLLLNMHLHCSSTYSCSYASPCSCSCSYSCSCPCSCSCSYSFCCSPGMFWSPCHQSRAQYVCEFLALIIFGWFVTLGAGESQVSESWLFNSCLYGLPGVRGFYRVHTFSVTASIPGFSCILSFVTFGFGFNEPVERCVNAGLLPPLCHGANTRTVLPISPTSPTKHSITATGHCPGPFLVVHFVKLWAVLHLHYILKSQYNCITGWMLRFRAVQVAAEPQARVASG